MRRRRNLITMLVLAAAVALLARRRSRLADETGASPAAVASPAPSPTATPALTITAAPAAVTAGDGATLTVRLPGLPNATVTLSRQAAGATGFGVVGPLVTNALGVATYRALPLGDHPIHRVEYAGDGVQWLPASAEVAVSVRPRVTFSATARVYRGERARLAVAVRPAHPGARSRWSSGGTARGPSGAACSSAPTPARSSRGAPAASPRCPCASSCRPTAAHLEGRSRACKVAVIKPNPYDVPVGAKGIVVVDISQYRLHFFSYGRELRSFPCVTGRPSLPTPLGHFGVPPGACGREGRTARGSCPTTRPAPSTVPTSRRCSSGSRGTSPTAAARQRERHLALRSRAARHAGLERALSRRALLGRGRERNSPSRSRAPRHVKTPSMLSGAAVCAHRCGAGRPGGDHEASSALGHRHMSHRRGGNRPLRRRRSTDPARRVCRFPGSARSGLRSPRLAALRVAGSRPVGPVRAGTPTGTAVLGGRVYDAVWEGVAGGGLQEVAG